MNCSKSLRSRPSQIQILRGSFAFYGSFSGRITGAFECFATSVRFEGVLATRFIIRIAFAIVRFTFGNFVVFHIIGLVRVNVAFRLSLPRPSHELRRTCLAILGKKREGVQAKDHRAIKRRISAWQQRGTVKPRIGTPNRKPPLWGRLANVAQ
jgi:hypothetical protein